MTCAYSRRCDSDMSRQVSLDAEGLAAAQAGPRRFDALKRVHTASSLPARLHALRYVARTIRRRHWRDGGGRKTQTARSRVSCARTNYDACSMASCPSGQTGDHGAASR